MPQTYIRRVAEGIGHGLRLMLVYEDAQGRITRRRIRPKHRIQPGDRFTAQCEFRGQVLAHVVQRALALSGTADPNEQAVTEMVPGELLKMARAWRRDPEGGMAGLG